jgi:hypothetical protein
MVRKNEDYDKEKTKIIEYFLPDRWPFWLKLFIYIFIAFNALFIIGLLLTLIR